MANEIQIKSNINEIQYFQIQNLSNQYWNGTAFENYNASNWGLYSIVLTNQGVGYNFFSASFPTTITNGQYNLRFYSQSSANPATTDTQINQGYYLWSGAVALPNCYATLAQVKTYLGISDSSQDTLLTQLIPQASQAITNYLQRNVFLCWYLEEQDGEGYSFLRAFNYPINSIYQIQLVNVFNSMNYAGSNFLWNTEGTIRWNYQTVTAYPDNFQCGFQNYLIQYQAGYAIQSLPQDLVLAFCQYVQYLWNFTSVNLTQDSVKAKDVTVQFGKSLIGDFSDSIFTPMRIVLDRYKLIGVL